MEIRIVFCEVGVNISEYYVEEFWY